MAYDYDKLYGQTPDALGAPTDVFVKFFERHELGHLRVLDVGCGQGRDALFIARKGHRVLGVDISPNGIRDLRAAAKRERLSVTGLVADLADYVPDGLFDLILIDRTLHMLHREVRCAVLGRLIDHVGPAGWLLIADEASNIPDFKAVIAGHKVVWTTDLARRGYLFLKRG